MRNLHELDRYRDTSPEVLATYQSTGDAENGVFRLPSPVDRELLLVVASSGAGWDHVSISRPRRTPSWREMDYIKRIFFKDDEVAVQFHVVPKNHVNIHPFCLHLWRPTDQPIPLPPIAFV